MGSYQLTLSPNYVPDWGINEGLRELFQNGIDREKETEGESKLSINYDPLARRLIIANQDSVLHKRTLLLGETSKDGKSSIGKYGEGYKLAMLVLLRNGIRMIIENYNEIWIPKIINSRTYECEILQVDTHKNKNSDGYLRFILDGVSPEHYSEYQKKCLMFHTIPDEEKIITDKGSILLNEKFSGHFYVSGLFVCKADDFKYGYDFNAGVIELDRDRQRVHSWNSAWETSWMWANQNKIAIVKDLYTLIKSKHHDCMYYNNHGSSKEIYKEICELSYKEFLQEHGELAVPVKTQEEAEFIKAKYGNLVPIVVPEKQFVYMSSSDSYRRANYAKISERTPTSWIEDWIIKHSELLNLQIEDTTIKELKEESKKWRYK